MGEMRDNCGGQTEGSQISPARASGKRSMNVKTLE
jgi:hypothetical protein